MGKETHENIKPKRGKKFRKGKGHRGLVRKYGINMGRRYFKEQALTMGFKKLD